MECSRNVLVSWLDILGWVIGFVVGYALSLAVGTAILVGLGGLFIGLGILAVRNVAEHFDLPTTLLEAAKPE